MVKNVFNNHEIHWWQFPLADFSIKFNNRFRDEFFNKVYSERSKSLDFANYINKTSKKYNKNWDLKRQRLLIWEYKNHTKFVPVWFIYETALYLDLNLLVIEKNIEAYITFRGKIEVYKPILPIKVTPEFIAIAVHAMCDGFYTQSGNFCYAQRDKNNLIRFISIVKNVFGDYNVVNSKRRDGTPTTYTPGIFAKIISKYYGIETYLSFNCSLTNKMKSSDNLSRLAILSSFLVDEGHTVTGAIFSSSNKKLLEDIIDITKPLGYRFNSLVTYYPNSNNKLTNKHYKLALSASTIEKFYRDLKYLFRRFPTLHMGKKFRNIEKLIKIKNRGWAQRSKWETKRMILDLLRYGDKTAYELRDLVNISLWTTYHHLQQLIKEKKVIKYRILSNKFFYRLV